MDQDTNPACPAGHGEMVPVMGKVKKGEIRRIEQNWECEACVNIVTVPLLLGFTRDNKKNLKVTETE